MRNQAKYDRENIKSVTHSHGFRSKAALCVSVRVSSAVPSM